MTLGGFLRIIYQIMEYVLGLIQVLYDILMDTHTIGRIKLFGFTIFEGVSFNIFNILLFGGGATFLVFLLMRLAKKFIPGI